MIHLSSAPSRGVRYLVRKRRIPTRATVISATPKNDLTSSAESFKDTATTDPTVPVSDLSINSTAVANTTDDLQPTSEATVVLSDVSSNSEQFTDSDVTDRSSSVSPSQPTSISPSHSTGTEEISSTTHTPMSAMKILNLANSVESNKQHHGCFSSSGNRPVSSRAPMSSDCRHQNGDRFEKVKLSLLSTVTLKRTAIQATATGVPLLHLHGNNMTSLANGRSAFGGGSLHGGVNVLLGGAMLSGLILLVFFICYCCQRSARKHEQNCRSQYWMQDPEAQLEVFTLDGQRFERPAGILIGPDTVDVAAFLHANTPSPPPPYETVVSKSVIAETTSLDFTGVCEDDLDGLPTYEAALKLEAQGRL